MSITNNIKFSANLIAEKYKGHSIPISTELQLSQASRVFPYALLPFAVFTM